jgi:hypothetical protein
MKTLFATPSAARSAARCSRHGLGSRGTDIERHATEHRVHLEGRRADEEDRA